LVAVLHFPRLLYIHHFHELQRAFVMEVNRFSSIVSPNLRPLKRIIKYGSNFYAREPLLGYWLSNPETIQ
jgi:hypothetical protein